MSTELYERVRLARALSGSGVEIGPGNAPITLRSGVSVTYVERPYAENYLAAHDMGGPNLLADQAVVAKNIDEEGLSWLADSSQDFVIACHVIEHLANPVRFLQECNRVLAHHGQLLLVVPDRERTFDFGRPGTPIEHVMSEYSEQCRVVDRAHVEAELRHAIGLPEGTAVDEAEIQRWSDLTVHAHCWTPAEFVALLLYLVHRGVLELELADTYFPDDHNREAGFEFGLLLKRKPGSGGPEGAQRMLEDYTLAVAARARSERARWHQCIRSLLAAKLIALPWAFHPDALYEIVLDEALSGRERPSRFLLDPLAAIELAASASNAPTGLGRVAAYWRGVLAGRADGLA